MSLIENLQAFNENRQSARCEECGKPLCSGFSLPGEDGEPQSREQLGLCICVPFEAVNVQFGDVIAPVEIAILSRTSATRNYSKSPTMRLYYEKNRVYLVGSDDVLVLGREPSEGCYELGCIPHDSSEPKPIAKGSYSQLSRYRRQIWMSFMAGQACCRLSDSPTAVSA